MLHIFPFRFARFSLPVFAASLGFFPSVGIISSPSWTAHDWHHFLFALFRFFADLNLKSKVAAFVLCWRNIIVNFNLQKGICNKIPLVESHLPLRRETKSLSLLASIPAWPEGSWNELIGKKAVGNIDAKKKNDAMDSLTMLWNGHFSSGGLSHTT